MVLMHGSCSERRLFPRRRLGAVVPLRTDANDGPFPLRQCQRDCLDACAQGARVVEMACGSGKTRVMKELVSSISGKVTWPGSQLSSPILLMKLQSVTCDHSVSSPSYAEVLIIVPSRALLDQFAADFPGFCKVGTGHNKKIDLKAKRFIAVMHSVHLLEKVKFDSIFVDEAHHPLPAKLPKSRELYQFSATYGEDVNVDFRYPMGKAIEDGVLSDYDITVPVLTAHHAYVCLADLLRKQAGKFRRVLAYCNSVAAAKRFRMVLKEVGLAAWHINGKTPLKRRNAVIEEFAGALQKPVHILVTVEVLGEGINIPNADTCMFVEPRGSYRSIVQAIGRVLRHHPEKTLAHVILPAVLMPNAAELVSEAVPGEGVQRKTRKPDNEPSLVGPHLRDGWIVQDEHNITTARKSFLERERARRTLTMSICRVRLRLRPSGLLAVVMLGLRMPISRVNKPKGQAGSHTRAVEM